MSSLGHFYPETAFGAFTDIDGTIAFYLRVNALLGPSFTVLDVGCGRGAYGTDQVLLRRNLQVLKNKVARVVGVDIDPCARDNPYIDEFIQVSGYHWPIATSSVDMIVCDFVLEHVVDPRLMLSEMVRVLKDGGHLCIRTSNRWHYVGMAAAIIPNRYHHKIVAKAQSERGRADVFPTFYRCNSVRTLRCSLQAAGIECVVYGYEAEPSYLEFSRFPYALGVMHQKFAPGFLKAALFAFGTVSKDSRIPTA